jgi:hypothetical protein
MLLTRNQFFLILFLIVIAPFLLTRLVWLANANKTKGKMAFVGHGDFGSALGTSTYAVIDFKVGGKTFSINSDLNSDLPRGEIVEVLYQKNDPADGIVNDFYSIWAKIIAYALFPVLVVVVLFIMPEKMDPIIPRKSKIFFGKKPMIKIIRSEQ